MRAEKKTLGIYCLTGTKQAMSNNERKAPWASSRSALAWRCCPSSCCCYRVKRRDDNGRSAWVRCRPPVESRSPPGRQAPRFGRVPMIVTVASDSVRPVRRVARHLQPASFLPFWLPCECATILQSCPQHVCNCTQLMPGHQTTIYLERCCTLEWTSMGE